MSAADVIARLVDRLDRAGVPYMVVGSFASTYHGRPRTTQDLDLVIDPTPSSLRAFLDLLPEEDYYASPEAATDALARRGMFNVIDLQTGWKVDRAHVERWAPVLGVEDAWRRIRGDKE